MMIVPRYSFNIGTIKWKAIEQQRIALENYYANKLQNFFDKQKRELIKIVNENPLDKVENILVAEVYRSAKKLQKLLFDLSMEIVQYFGNQMINNLYKKFTFDPWIEGCLNWILQNAASKVANITATTEAKIKAAVYETFEQNEDTSYLAKAIEYDTAFSKTRSLRIARTEIVAASNAGSKYAMDQTGMQYYKIWVSARDARVRKTHASADGQKVEADEPFVVGGSKLLFPGDSSMGAAAKEIVNCRCTTVFEIKPEVAKPKVVRNLPAEDIRSVNLENTIVEGPHGTVLRIDKHAVENQRFVLKRVEINGQEQYITYFKFTEPEVNKLAAELMASNKVKMINEVPYFEALEVSRDRLRGGFYRLHGQCLKYESKDYTMYFIHDEKLTSLRGQMMIVSKNKIAAEKAFADIGRLDLLTEPEDYDIEKIKLLQHIWQQAPAVMTKIRPNHGIVTIKKLLKKYGGSRADEIIEEAKTLKEIQVLANYKTYAIERTKEIQKAGGVELFSGIGADTKRVVSIFKNFDGLICLNERILTTGFGGSSASADIESGGANYFFTRLVTKTGQKYGFQYRKSFAGAGYRVHIDISELNRTDWFAYHYDEYGTVARQEVFYSRDTPIDFVKKQNTYPSYDNEVMFKNGVSLKSVKFISCDYEHMRKALIDEFRANGITTINGKDIEDFIIVKEKW